MQILKAPPQGSDARIIFTSAGRGWSSLEADLIAVPGGVSIQASDRHRLCMHFGASASTIAYCDDIRQKRVQAHGNFDVIPAGLEGRVDGNARTFLRLMVAPGTVRQIVHDAGRNPDKAFLRPRFRSRDARLESVAWAIKAEIENPVPSDPLYAESLAVALVVRLVEEVGELAAGAFAPGQTLSTFQRKRVSEYVEAHLDQPLTLAEIAGVAGISVSHLKTLFNRTFGMPVHRYVMNKRVDHAKQLLLEGTMPISQIALAAGFSHQSHMARCMRQICGVTPRDVAKLAA